MAQIFGQLEFAQLHILAADPTPVEGQIWYNSVSFDFKLRDNSAIRTVHHNAKAVVGTNATANNNVRLHRSGTAKFQFVLGGDATADGSVSANFAEADIKIQGYANFAALPAAGVQGRMAFVIDVLAIYVDNGTAWKLASGGQLTRLADQSVAASGTITTGTDPRLLKGVQGSGGAQTADATTPIAAGTSDGQELRLIGLSDVDTLTLLAGGNLKLNGDVTLAAGQTIDLTWDDPTSKWTETTRSN